jgi:hypothetical protein
MKTVIALLAATLVLAGCGSSDGGSSGSTSDQPVTVDIAVKDGKVTPQGDRVDVKVGQKVTLHITSDADEEIHVHSEPEHEYEVKPGDDVKESFTITTPGQVAVEAHHLDVTIVQLVVKP